MKLLLITCREATLLVLKREEGKVSSGDGFRLGLHLLLCKFCKLFERQLAFMARQIKNIHSSASLTPDEMKHMKILVGKP